ncbi:MAG: small ribosomal subunit Rsm22 family protein [Nitrospira sp.]|nr:small ribosomal subunit Rsm22 family protein [Nitrospira sp.]
MSSLNVATVSPSLLEAIERVCGETGVPLVRIHEAVGELSRRFTNRGEKLGGDYFNHPKFLAAYLRYFLPVNLAKIQILLDEMPSMEAAGPIRVLDVGSGPGTGALGVVDWWRSHGFSGELSVTAVDQSVAALNHARRLWSCYCRMEADAKARLATHRLITYRENLERRGWYEKISSTMPFDLIIVANSLNEIGAGSKDPITVKTELLSDLLDGLAPHGTLMIVEPALRETSRSLHQVRDRLIKAGNCTVYSPCLHDRNCPALDHPDDWCHEERPWEPPASVRDIDRVVGFIKDGLKFSYLLLRKDGRAMTARRSHVYRVVSELRVMKGEKRAWVCNEGGRIEVGRLDRLASPRNVAFEEIRRGDIVYIETLSRKVRQGTVSSLARIDHDAIVSIVRNA